MIDQFREWFITSAEEEMSIVYQLLQDRLSDEVEEMISQAKDCETWKSRLSFILAEAETWLERASQYYLPTGEDKKELEKRTEMKAKIADIREVKDKIEGLIDAIDTRITLVQSNLKHEGQKGEVAIKAAAPY